MGRSRYCTARSANMAAAATALSRTSTAESRTWCSTFSVRSRLVIPLWTCSCPASALNSSMRAFTSCLVIRSR